MSSTPSKLSKVCAFIFDIVPNSLARSFAVASPTPRIPSAYIKRPNVVSFDLRIDSIRFLEDFSPNRSKPTRDARSSVYRSVKSLIILFSSSWSIIFSPRPSISIAFLEQKCIRDCFFCALQSIPALHLRTASPNSLTRADPHSGHLVGIINFLAFPGLFSWMAFITSGTTSPALLIRT